MSEKYIRQNRNSFSVVFKSHNYGTFKNLEHAILIRDYLYEHEWNTESIEDDFIKLNNRFIIIKVIDEKEPKTIYAICKLAAEHSLAAYANAFDIPYTILRVCVPYGSLIDGEYSYGTVGFMLQKAKAGEDITLFDGGQYKRTFTNMKDLCKQFYKAGISAKAKNRIYNITGDTYTIREVADFISTKYNISIKEIPYPEQEKKLETGNTFFEDNNHS